MEHGGLGDGTAPRSPAATWRLGRRGIAQRVTLEPFKVMKWTRPTTKAYCAARRLPSTRAKSSTIELLLKGTTSALLRRYQGSHDAGEKRQQVAFALANEALAKVVGDISAEK